MQNAPGERKNIDFYTKKLNTLPYSDGNMRFVCEDRVNILSYRDIMKCDSLEEVLGPQGAAIILYETKPQYGHWVAFFRSGPHEVEFFDSYGFPPDSELQFVPKSMGCYPRLEELCRKAGFTCIYNKCKLQSDSSHVSTCGRWASVRVSMRKIKLEDFIGLFTKTALPPDDYLTHMTMLVPMFSGSANDVSF